MPKSLAVVKNASFDDMVLFFQIAVGDTMNVYFVDLFFLIYGIDVDDSQRVKSFHLRDLTSSIVLSEHTSLLNCYFINPSLTHINKR